MRLNCGLSHEEKLTIENEKIMRIYKWHKWFAWTPVQIASGHCRWLETVERCKILNKNFGYYTWKYRTENKE